VYFTVRKLQKMNFRLRADKVALVLKKTEEELKSGGGADTVYLKSICRTVISEMEKAKADLLEKEAEKISAPHLPPEELLFLLNNIRYIILSEIGRDPAEWDLSTYSDSTECGDRKILDINVYLDNIRSPFNVGSVFRTAESFCFSRVLLSEYTPSPDQKRALRSSMGTSEIVEWDRCEVEKLPSPVFALELGGSSIEDFSFPETGTAVIGSEELGVSPEAMKRAKSEGGIVTIPLFGCKSSVNVGVAFGILAYNWVSCISK
jgi:TrmH family RNA methyltransferase